MATNQNGKNSEAERSTASTGVVDRVTGAAVTARDTVLRRADDVTDAANEALESRPFGALAGAIAIGAVAAALVPATATELKALGPIATRLRDMAEAAFQEARQAGMAELSAAGLTLAAASDGTGGLVGKLVKAATAAATAAASSARGAVDSATDVVSNATGQSQTTSTPATAASDHAAPAYQAQ